MADNKKLNEMLDSIISENSEEAQVAFHTYLTEKMRETLNEENDSSSKEQTLKQSNTMVQSMISFIDANEFEEDSSEFKKLDARAGKLFDKYFKLSNLSKITDADLIIIAKVANVIDSLSDEYEELVV